ELKGGEGNDTYVFRIGSGTDTITNYYPAIHADVIKFEDVKSTELRAVRREGYKLILEYGSSDQVIVNDHFSGSAYAIDQIQFSDGVTLTASELLQKYGIRLTAGDDNISFFDIAETIYGDTGNDTISAAAGDDMVFGNEGNDILNGEDGNDTLDGGVGADTLKGGVGNDTYVFRVGSGVDTITNYYPSVHADVIKFEDVKSTELRAAKKEGNNLVLEYGVSDRVTVTDHFSGANYMIDQIQFADGVVLTADQVLAKYQVQSVDKANLKDWYSNTSNHSIANLQMVIEGGSDYDTASADQLKNKKIEQFNFDGLVAKFDQARVANPSLTSWTWSSSLLEFYLNGSDTEAIGGDLAYQYAKSGNLSALSMNPAQAILASPQFGVSNQLMQGSNALRDASVQLV
ncbi:MAG: hypothetical protein HY253_07775, partial [Burkholderiales bacterium]|nr:hypothetical protein [Burkholderiales bacterium]